MSGFKERFAIVTGSGRGIGRAIALELARNGVNVAVNFFRNRETAEMTAQEIESLGVRSLLVRANVGEMKDLERIFASVSAEWPGLDILVNNAASGYNRPIEEQKPRGWDWTMNINARSVLFGSQFALPLMKKRGGGHIINITSMGSQRVIPDYSIVGASKAAIETITMYLACEFAPHGISVNAVSPGMVITEALSHFRSLNDDLEREILKVTNRTPAGRLTTGEDVARLVTFLCSPNASMIRGQTIIVDGGYTLSQGHFDLSGGNSDAKDT